MRTHCDQLHLHAQTYCTIEPPNLHAQTHFEINPNLHAHTHFEINPNLRARTHFEINPNLRAQARFAINCICLRSLVLR